MFGSFKKKLGNALNIFSKKIEEESSPLSVEEESEVIGEIKEIKKETKKSIKKNLVKETPEKNEAKNKVSKEKINIINVEKEEQLKETPKKEKKEVKIFPKEKEPKDKDEKEKSSQELNENQEESLEESIEEEPKEKKRFLGIFKRKETIKKKETIELEEDNSKEITKDSIGESKEKKSFFKKPLIKINISEKKFEDLFWDIELALLENNVAVEVIEKLKSDLKENLLNHKLNAFALQKKVQETFQNSISELFDIEPIDLLNNIQQKKPYVIAFIGVNGSGKTTSLAKVAYMLKKQNISIVIAACDNFRAAALHQIEEHANNLDIKLIKHDYGSDSAAVAFDAIKHAESKCIDVVLIDTAGRSHSNINLMDELKKVIRVSKPDLKIFVGDSLTGNDTVDQAKSFDEAVGVDAIILSKMDIDEKGGASISVSYVTKKPILFNGTGQEYNDLEVFDKNKILNALDF